MFKHKLRMSPTIMTSYGMRKFATFNTQECNKRTSKKWNFSSALWQPRMSIFFLQFLYARLYHTTTYFFSLLRKIFVNFNFLLHQSGIQSMRCCHFCWMGRVPKIWSRLQESKLMDIRSTLSICLWLRR